MKVRLYKKINNKRTYKYLIFYTENKDRTLNIIFKIPLFIF